MEYTKELKLSNGNIIYYKEVNGTCYETAIFLQDENRLKEYPVTDKLFNILEQYRQNKCRVRIWYCSEDGKAWNEEYDVTGTIGRSTGENYKIPLLISSRKSFGGPALNVGVIGRIDDIEDRVTIYKRDNFSIPSFTMEHKDKTENGSKYNFYVYADGEHIASFTTEAKAKRWIDFMTGKRYGK